MGSGKGKRLKPAIFRLPGQLRESCWCGREDSNFHGLSATTTSTLRVYQFRHDRTLRTEAGNPASGKAQAISKAFGAMQARWHIYLRCPDRAADAPNRCPKSTPQNTASNHWPRSTKDSDRFSAFFGTSSRLSLIAASSPGFSFCLSARVVQLNTSRFC